MEIRKQPGHEMRRKYKKYGLRKMEKYYVKQEENTGENGDLMEPDNLNKTMEKVIVPHERYKMEVKEKQRKQMQGNNQEIK